MPLLELKKELEPRMVGTLLLSYTASGGRFEPWTWWLLRAAFALISLLGGEGVSGKCSGAFGAALRGTPVWQEVPDTSLASSVTKA